MKPLVQHQKRLSLALVLLLMAAFAIAPLGTVTAAPDAQESEPLTLYLGEYVVEDLANGEVRDYVIEIPEDGTYETRIIDEDDAISFDLIITDEAGNELFNDVFGELTLELPAGQVMLRFEAVDSAQLAFALLGNLGDMTDDIESPGELLAGGIYYNESVTDPLYGILSVPETPYPQKVTVYFEPGAEATFYVSAEGEDIGYVDQEASQESGLLTFYSHGGDYLISAETYEDPAELTLIPFLSGPPELLTPDEPTEGVIPAGEYSVIYGLQLDRPYDEVVISADSVLDEIDITVVDHLYDTYYFEANYGEGELYLESLQPGDYYVIVETFDIQEENLPVTLLVTGEAGEPLDTVQSGDLLKGVFEEGDEEVTYMIDVAEPGTLISAALTSRTEDSDFDLEAGINLDETIWSTFDIGSEDVLTFLAPVAGSYFLRVISNEGVGEFALAVEDLGVAPPIALDELIWGSVEEGGVSLYSLEVPEAGGLLTIALVGEQDVDLDLRFAGYDEQGDTLAYASSYSFESAEIVSAPMEEPGLYEIEVTAEYSDGGNYVLWASMIDPSRIARQWATEAVASSQYGEDGYSAMQVTGQPDTPAAGDYPSAWAPEEQDAGEETLELTYENTVVPSAVNIHETYNPGAVVSVAVYDADFDEWVVVWEGEAGPTEEPMRVFSPELEDVNFATNVVRLTLATDAVEGWNEIDAVELVGRP